MYIQGVPRNVSPVFSNMLDSMHQAHSAMTIRFVGQAMEVDNQQLTIEAAELWQALIDTVPNWLKDARTPEDYTFLANAIAGIANLTVIMDQVVMAANVFDQVGLIEVTKAKFGNWKAELRKKSRDEEAKTLLDKLEYLEACILDAKPPRRPKWEMITK